MRHRQVGRHEESIQVKGRMFMMKKTHVAGVMVLVLWIACLAQAQPSDNPGDWKIRMRRSPVVEVYQQARDSLVNFSATERVVVERWGVSLFGDVFRVPAEQSQRSVGSGFVIHENGYIATNAHVVSSGSELVATFADGSEYEARVVARDTERDLAVVKVNPDKPLKPIKLGRSNDLMIGEQTIAIGNPVGLQNSVTTGVISALHRELPIGGNVVYRDVIQTDASINPGNSGGPLLNILGELIGINTAIRTDAQNIGFAIPVDQLHDVLPDMLNPETLNQVNLGIRISGKQPGLVIGVKEGSPADEAGIELGDRILNVDGEPIQRGVDFYVQMLSRQAGDTAKVRLARGEKALVKILQLEPAPIPDGPRLARELIGVTVANANEDVARRLGWPKLNGVIVIAVEKKSPADRADIRPGDLMVSMGQYWLVDVNQVGRLLSQAESGDPIDIGIRRKVRGRLYGGEVRLYAR